MLARVRDVVGQASEPLEGVHGLEVPAEGPPRARPGDAGWMDGGRGLGPVPYVDQRAAEKLF